jgi:hypothetical protein
MLHLVRGSLALIAAATAIAASPHCRLHLRRLDCPNYRVRNGRRRTSWRGSSRRRRHNCRRRTRNCRQTIGDLRGGAAITSSAHKQISVAPPTAISNAAIALVMDSSRAEPRDSAALCAAKSPRPVNIRRQMWQPRSLIIQAKCGTSAATDRFIPVLVQRER